MQIKNWHEYQHYKDRDPKWIKLYKKILDDPEWHKLDGQSAKVLVMLWLLASEEHGELPGFHEIAFRLRVPEKTIESICSKLSHWLVQPASNTLAEPYQPASLERELYKEEKKREPHRAMSDTEFWESLKTNVAYQHINLDIERGKMSAWFALPKNKSRLQTQRFVLNWLNKIDRPMQLGGAASQVCQERVQRGAFLKPCGEPSVVQIGGQPRCQTHKEAYESRISRTAT